jgi:hypothetical protein
MATIAIAYILAKSHRFSFSFMTVTHYVSVHVLVRWPPRPEAFKVLNGTGVS